MLVTAMTRALLLALALLVIPASGAEAQRPTQVVLAMWGLPTRLVGGLEAAGSYVLLQIHDVRGWPRSGPAPPTGRHTRSRCGRRSSTTASR